MSDFWIEDGETVLFIGDSITDCDRRSTGAPLGSGYVGLFAEWATARFPTRQIRYMNEGISGNRVTHLRERWRDDVLAHRPDRLSIKIGINDASSHLRGDEQGVSPHLFGEYYDEILALTQQKLGCPIVLVTPFYIARPNLGDAYMDQMLELLPRYIETVEMLSEKYDTRLVRLHEIFQRQLEFRDPDQFCPEPVHPNRAGHMVIAAALMEVMGG